MADSSRDGGGDRVDTGHECAFYDSTLLFGKDLLKGAQPGVYVLDMADPAHPVGTAVLLSPAGQSPHESLRLNQERGLLVTNMGGAQTYPGFVDVYDVSADAGTPSSARACRWPSAATRAASRRTGRRTG